MFYWIENHKARCSLFVSVFKTQSPASFDCATPITLIYSNVPCDGPGSFMSGRHFYRSLRSPALIIKEIHQMSTILQEPVPDERPYVGPKTSSGVGRLHRSYTSGSCL